MTSDDTESDATDSDEQVEGDGASDEGLDAYPLDAVLIRTEQRTIVDVLRRIERKTILLDPDFQRDFVWDQRRQSRLIESILMRIPLPVIYVAENKSGKLVVVDGLQRLTTLQQFHEKKLTLDLPKSEIHGRTFDRLEPRLRNRFEDGQLLFYIIDAKAPERVRLDIFDRVNSGVPLTRQQMRNALYNGPATRLLRDLAETDEFKKATGYVLSRGQKVTDQRDREAINRFLAFYVQSFDSYREMDEWLGGSLEDVNAQSDEQRAGHRTAFLASMRANLAVFGAHAFRKHTGSRERRRQFNVVLFELFSTLFARWPEAEFLDAAKAEKIRAGYYSLMESERFLRTISSTTTSAETVRRRFELAQNMLVGVLGAAPA